MYKKRCKKMKQNARLQKDDTKECRTQCVYRRSSTIYPQSYKALGTYNCSQYRQYILSS